MLTVTLWSASIAGSVTGSSCRTAPSSGPTAMGSPGRKMAVTTRSCKQGLWSWEDDVEVQAHSCVDRATVGETRIKTGAKIDNLVQVGHACTVGENSLLCAQVGLAGSTELGRNVLLAGQAASAGHLKMGDGAVLTAQSAVIRDVPAGQMVSGSPSMDNKLWRRCITAFSRLPELLRTVRDLKGEVERLRKSSRKSKRKTA